MPKSFLENTPSPSRSGFNTPSRSPSPSLIRNLSLRVTAGPTYSRETHVNVNVNDPEEPTFIDSEHFTGWIVVRVRCYAGVPGKNGVIEEDDEYFSDTKDTYSIMFGGWFHQNGKMWNVDDVVFVNDFDESIAEKLPTGTSIGLKAIKMIDPSYRSLCA